MITERDLKRSTVEQGVYLAKYEDGRTLFIVKRQEKANQFTPRRHSLFVRAVVVTYWLFEIHDPISEVATISSPIRTRREALAAANEFVANNAIGTAVADADEEAVAS